MSVAQMLSFAVIATMMAFFVWGRFRYDVVAIMGLLACVALGLVPFDQAFSGFSDDVVVIVACALVTSAAIARTGLADRAIRRCAPHLATTGRQIALLAGLTMALSGFVKNIGAMSMLMPSAWQLAARTGVSASRLLMPMSFASLLGGIVTLVGTSPNILVSRIRAETSGEAFRMFDFAPVGAPVALAGLVYLILAWRLLPERTSSTGMDAAFAGHGYTIEAIVPEGAALAGQPASALTAPGHGEVRLTALIRDTHKRFRNPTTQTLRPGDHVLLEGKAEDIDSLIAAAGLRLPRPDKIEKVDPEDERGTIEAVVTADSLMLGWSPAQLRLSDRFAVDVIGVSRRGVRVSQRLKNFRFAVGDVVALGGNLRAMPDILSELGLLPLAPRGLEIGKTRLARWLPVVILALAMLLMGFKVVSVPIAFFGAAALIVASGAMSPRAAYEALDPAVLVTLAALIPVSETLRTTGASDLISGWLAAGAGALPPMGALALIMTVAMAVTPFLNNAATVLVAAPIAAGFAKSLGYNADPFLMAVAVGAACDFLTPIGHQCNMLVMGPGGYRFGDYWRLGLPLSLLVVALATPLIGYFWPLTR
jgi:di/tricarboxylate transporter